MGRRKQEEGGTEGGNKGREGTEGGNEGGREGAREEAMMLCRERASVEEERVECLFDIFNMDLLNHQDKLATF